MSRLGRIKRILKLAATGITLLIVLTVIGLLYLARTRVPDLERTVLHPSIKSEVTVIRDDWGVPHIEAANETDAYFALGYCMAQDRLFQMEILSMVVQFFGSWPQTAVSMRNKGCLVDIKSI
jgi:penicillin amidase